MNAKRFDVLVAFVSAALVANICFFFTSFEKVERTSHEPQYESGIGIRDVTKQYTINLPVIKAPSNPKGRMFLCLMFDCVLLLTAVGYLVRRKALYEEPLPDGYLLSADDDFRLIQAPPSKPLKDRPLTIDPEPIKGELLMPIKSIGVKRTPT